MSQGGYPGEVRGLGGGGGGTQIPHFRGGGGGGGVQGGVIFYPISWGGGEGGAIYHITRGRGGYRGVPKNSQISRYGGGVSPVLRGGTLSLICLIRTFQKKGSR